MYQMQISPIAHRHPRIAILSSVIFICVRTLQTWPEITLISTFSPFAAVLIVVKGCDTIPMKGGDFVKDFQDYCSYLLEKTVTEPASVPAMAKIYTVDSLTPENLQALMQNYSEEILAAAGGLAMYYLRIYHEWLEQQLP